MKYKKYWAIAPMILLSVFLSSSVRAQTFDSSNSNNNQGYRWWRGQSSELQQKVDALDKTAVTSVYIPVLFGVETRNISPNFGDPRSGGRSHAGEDIMAVKGTPIVSPTAAVVIRIGVGPSEGNYVYTANPGGETFVYMHLDKFGEGVALGTVLEKGSLIGYVGNTGNASGGAAHLHFEIHNNSGTPTDPYPRLTGTFTLQEKIQYLTKILTQSNDSNALAQFLVGQFRSTFTSATSVGITLPSVITNFLASMPNTTPTQPVPITLPIGDLALGSQGIQVVRLQQFLINKNTGSFAVRLSQAGATGNFGVITQSALKEYQSSVGISPADGYYGPSTRVLVEGNITPQPPIVTTPTSPTNTTINRNLTLNTVGEDVRTLQKFLNTHGFIVSSSGAGSLGSETIYFGNATRAAVIRFQIAYNISPSVGYVGAITRAKLVSLGI